MAQDFGSGVSRTLSAAQRQFQVVVFQAGRPPLDSEVNLLAQVDWERTADLVRSTMHSGWLVDPLHAAEDFQTNPSWSNFFQVGRQISGETAPLTWVNVNGWFIPVVGTSNSEGVTENRVDLWPPPASDARIDLVFLEVWLAQVAPNPSTENKPSADRVWKWGNVKYGGTNPLDDLEDPAIGYETTERVQIQYRIRVFGQGAGAGSSVALDVYPDGLGDPNVLGQGSASAPVAGMPYTNMRESLGDPGLWRAGDGDPDNTLGTVDGYSYAIPLCAVFRRNTTSFVARTSAGNANQNGAVNRNPIVMAMTNPAEGTVTLGTATLTNAITEVTTGNVQVEGLVGSGLDNANINWASMFLMLDDEIISIESVNTGVSPATMRIRAANGRGRWGTMAVPHAAGTTVQFFNWQVDGLLADQIADMDILDLRKAVVHGEWDYNALLMHNLSKLLKGELRSSYKQSGISDTQGPVVIEVDTLSANGAVAVPNQTEALDGPDGIRTVWSDAATPQGDVTLLLAHDAPQVGGFVAQFDTGFWDVGAQFIPGGFMTDATGPGWNDGTAIFVYIGGTTGSNGARETFRDGTERAVRFMMPREAWKAYTGTTGRQTPVTLRFLNEAATIPAAGTETAVAHPGPMYPLPEQNFEYPFIVLGGVVNDDAQVPAGVEVFPETAPGSADWEVALNGLDFDTAGDWYSLSGGAIANDPSVLTHPVLHGTRTLWSLLTRDGQDLTGASSELYLVIWGDNGAGKLVNNGCVRVVGAGTVGYTTRSATAADRVRVELMTAGVTDFVNTAGLDGELRTMYAHSADDTGGSTAGKAAMCIVLTDITGTVGGTQNPWNAANLGGLAITQPVESNAVLNTTLLYHPGRAGTARVADTVERFALVIAGSEYLRKAPGSLDATFPTAAGVPANETYFDVNPIQTWNRLTSLGLTAPNAPNYGGNLVSFSEQDREAELFVDPGSKTVLFRPFSAKDLTLRRQTLTAGTLIPTVYPLGFNTDGAGIFVVAKNQGYEVPPEYMPRFGRQDIPFYYDQGNTGLGTFLNGINHLFLDTTNDVDPQFNIIGGQLAGGGGGVLPIRFQTGATSGLNYGQWGAIPGSGQSGYQSRLYSDTSVTSSDLGRGLKGIQLPPWFGVARVYGVYDLRDFVAAGGSTFEADRVTPAAGSPPNLLRTDAKKQTLFIVEGGASDVTSNSDDHTYVLPEDAIDIGLSGSIVAGETFEDLDYVVEVVGFGFSRGWINKNNYVLARLRNGSGAVADLDLLGARMCIPAAASLNDQAYVAYYRTVYQGDVYMSRNGAVRTVSDYEHRYGQIDQSDAFAATPCIQQINSAGDLVPETSNPRALEVLAQADFWTTLGTGKVGGNLYPGTPLDVGFVYENKSGETYTRLPASASTPPWQVHPRAFTEGQKSNTSHAYMSLVVTDNTALAGTTISITPPGETAVVLSAGAEWVVGANASATATNIATAIQASVALNQWVRAVAVAQEVRVIARLGGTDGEAILVAVSDPTGLYLDAPLCQSNPGTVTRAYLAGGVNKVMNATKDAFVATPIRLTGVTERLPLGLLLQDFDFMGEDPLHDGVSFLESTYGKLSAASPLPVPLSNGVEFTRVVGGVGTMLGMSDGGILRYTPYHETSSPAGSRNYRLYRGGGSLYVISGDEPGGPVDWAAGSFPAAQEPVVKGAVLLGRAYLVRNLPETAFVGNQRTSPGDEVQMVILTQGLLGSGSPSWTPSNEITLSGMISPTGFGEGYAAADRYRLEGKPQSMGRTREAPSLTPDMAIFPFTTIAKNATGQ